MRWSWCCSVALRRFPARLSARSSTRRLNIWLVSQTDLSKLVLGGFIVLIVVAFPKGIVGTLETIRNRRRSSTRNPRLLTSRIETAE